MRTYALMILASKMTVLLMIYLQSSGNQANMTVVNIKGWGSSLKDLDKFILMALFKGRLKLNQRYYFWKVNNVETLRLLCKLIYRRVHMAKQLALRPLISGLNPAGGKIFSESKQRFIAQPFIFTLPSPWKGCKAPDHPSINLLYPWHLCRGVYSFRLSKHPFVSLSCLWNYFKV